jgi:putative DNA methylase
LKDLMQMTDRPRLIEMAFPLKQASLDSVYEKNIRHGHISTLHIWPARRPLAACRAALIATLLPDPGNDAARQELLERIGGKVVRTMEKKQEGNHTVEVVKEQTEGGILHWNPAGGPDLDWFREEIRNAYDGRPPRVLDPFAGGGAIPLEAMRLGCETTALDINPLAWFVLKCTLEYPQKLAGQVLPLPKFAVDSREFMQGFFEGTGVKGQRQLQKNLDSVQQGLFPPPDVGLVWHVRAWAWWVLQRARADLASFYPVVNDKPTVAYLWARIVTCKNCRATIPLLKTKWLCKTNGQRILLKVVPNADLTGVIFGIQSEVPVVGGNAAQRKAHDKMAGAGTMNRSGVTCPCCGMPSMTMEDIRLEGQAGRLGLTITAVAVDGTRGKEYRLPTSDEHHAASEAKQRLQTLFASVPFGLPEEPTPVGGGRGAGRAFSLRGYGLNRWCDLFTDRQLLALGTLVKHTRAAFEAMPAYGYTPGWVEAITAYLACGVDRLVDYCNVNVQWKIDRGSINHSLVRFAIQFTWDFAEGNPISDLPGSYWVCLNRVLVGLETVLGVPFSKESCTILAGSATAQLPQADVVMTDPPYYDAIPYSDLMDWFYVWTRRIMSGVSDDYSRVMAAPLCPKWNAETQDGELVDDASRHKGDDQKSRAAYEDGMARVFARCAAALTPEGRMVVVFANKQPTAWETLVSSVIRAGFVVDGSWPIMTEQPSRTRGQSSAALASSVWLVCKKRPAAARPGWDNRVLEEMRTNIHQRLRAYWDAGIRGPDFVWAATGPALEAYSKHPVVKKATAPGETMSVSEFLRAVRRLVVDFVVGRVLVGNGDGTRVEGLDDITTYYLLHRHDFGTGEAPAGACILYAVSCGLSDSALVDRHDLLLRTGGKTSADEDEDEGEEEADGDEGGGSGSKVKLRPWSQRKRKTMGYDVEGRPAPLVDQVHRLLHLWKGGELVKVDEYLNDRGL